MTKRYRTSERGTLSQASLMAVAWMSSVSGSMPWSAQKSSISWVSARPPVDDPAKERRFPNGEHGHWQCRARPASVATTSMS